MINYYLSKIFREYVEAEQLYNINMYDLSKFNN